MGKFYVELRTLRPRLSLTGDLARHLFTRLLPGLVVIVADNPRSLLAALRKQWHKLVNLMERERSRTLHAGRKQELLRLIAFAQKLPFSLREPHAATAVVVVTPQQVAHLPRAHTMYITNSLTSEVLEATIATTHYHGLIVTYDSTVAQALTRGS